MLLFGLDFLLVVSSYIIFRELLCKKQIQVSHETPVVVVEIPPNYEEATLLDTSNIDDDPPEYVN